MRYTLKDYQAAAVRDVLRNLEKARGLYRQFGSLSQFSLSATTGAGKTVMAAAVIEALFFGSDEFDFAEDPGAVVLWFSDDPSLNEQSRARIQAASSELDGRLRAIESTFSESSLRPGNVYFLNAQKLSKNSRLVRGEQIPEGQERLFAPRPDEAQTSIYDVLANTIDNPDLTLYFVIDEAHRGMSQSRARKTIVQRLINGAGDVPSMPVVFGISATVERFETAMKGITGRDALASVEVDSKMVQESGLLKDDIVLSIPAERGVFDTVLLRRAVGKIISASKQWDAYAQAQGTDPVRPLLVVQVEDKASNERLLTILDTIYEAWPELGIDAVANVFGEHTNLLLGQQVVPYIEPQRVQDADYIRVLLAKSAISTGWDCPRAEVLVSFRPAADRTHITQLLGRMIRTPLARRIAGNELLNSVDCLLPFFDRDTAESVADMLMAGATSKDDDNGTGGGEGRRVLFDPVDLMRNPAIDEAVWARFEELPSVTIPKTGTKPIRRLTALAVALSKDELVDGAVAEAHKRMHAVLDGRAVQYKELLAAARHDVLTMSGEERRRGWEGWTPAQSFEESADPRAIEDSYRAATRALSPGLCASYVDHLVGVDGDDDELLEANIDVAALGLVPVIVEEVEREADELARAWLSETRVARKGLPDDRQAEYERLEAQSTVPERVSLLAPVKAQTESKVRAADGTVSDLPTRAMHLMSTEDGQYPVDLNDWEVKVVDSEARQPGFAGWYRNPARASKDSLAVAYKDETGVWKALRPDFIFFTVTSTGAVVADIVDPHSFHLADAMTKLRGLAEFAERYEGEVRRIESVAEVDGRLRLLDLTRRSVRQAVREARGAKELYESDLADNY